MASEWANSRRGLDLHLDFDPAGDGRRTGLEVALRTAIRDGRLAPGARLPATRALADELGVARGTVTAAYGQLVAEGYLSARRGSGTVVARVPSADRAPREPLAPPPAAPRFRHDLSPGRPDVSAFPVQAWLNAARTVLPRVEPAAFALGDPRGRPELRAALAEYLGRTRGVIADPDTIVVTSGYMQALGLVARVLHDQGCTRIAMENPCAPFHREVVRRAGLDVVPLPVDEIGAAGRVPADVGAVVLTPAHQATLGVVLGPARRRALLDWAASTGGVLLEDDYDGELSYRQQVGALQGMAPEHVVYAGTASKTLGPAVRLGWLVLPRRLVDAVAEAKFYADAQTESIGQLVLAELIRRHDYDRHVRVQRLKYRRRRRELLYRLARDVPAVRVHGAAAGVQVLLELPAGGPTETEVVDIAARRGIRLVGLGRGWHGDRGSRLAGILVGYATPADHAWSPTLDALIDVLRSALTLDQVRWSKSPRTQPM
ncbi:MocR-like pyridoxine biosynthesis transcription factor PdxR [Pseudonocardia adelaidensis]|uniref:PLP-dependent aminotransferase family protein n=1 Tax=Pseudonocardia adelaidensis TaxID=648754 RepID=A0ABP9NPL0_9PSEU